jgi:plastocyanin
MWRILTMGVVGVGFWLLPSVAGATRVGADIVEPSPTNFQIWTFKPGAITVHVGDVVVWTNTGQNPHTVTADSATFDSGNLTAGASFSFTFTKAGTFTYKCGYHPWMKGTIQVVGAVPATATTVSASPIRVPPSPTAAESRAAPVLPTTTAARATGAASPSAVASPTVAATATDAPATATTVPPSPTTPPPTASPAPVTPTGAPLVALVAAPQPPAAAQPTAAAQPPAPAPTAETTSSFAGAGPIVGGVVALILLAGIGGVVLPRLRAEKRAPTSNKPHES